MNFDLKRNVYLFVKPYLFSKMHRQRKIESRQTFYFLQFKLKFQKPISKNSTLLVLNSFIVEKHNFKNVEFLLLLLLYGFKNFQLHLSAIDSQRIYFFHLPISPVLFNFRTITIF